MRPGDRKAAAAATGKPVEGGKAPKADKDPGDLSFAQVQRLHGFRTAVLRSELATQPRIALAAMAADLARRIVLEEYDGEPIVRLTRDHHTPATPIREGLDIGQRPALDALEEQWRVRLEPHADDLFTWLLQEPESTTLELLAFVAASTILAGDNMEQKVDRGRAFAHLAGVDMAQHWQVTEEWLAAQPKPYILAVVAETCGKKNADRIATLKKVDLARRAAELIIESETGPGAKPRWLPKPLRAPATKPARPRVARGKAAAANDVPEACDAD